MIEFKRTYTKEEALKAVPILTAKDVPAMISGGQLHQLAVKKAIRQFNEKGGEK